MISSLITSTTPFVFLILIITTITTMIRLQPIMLMQRWIPMLPPVLRRRPPSIPLTWSIIILLHRTIPVLLRSNLKVRSQPFSRHWACPHRWMSMCRWISTRIIFNIAVATMSLRLPQRTFPTIHSMAPIVIPFLLPIIITIHLDPTWNIVRIRCQQNKRCSCQQELAMITKTCRSSANSFQHRHHPHRQDRAKSESKSLASLSDLWHSSFHWIARGYQVSPRWNLRITNLMKGAWIVVEPAERSMLDRARWKHIYEHIQERR